MTAAKADTFAEKHKGRVLSQSVIIPATHLPAKTSCRILVRAGGFVTSYLGSKHSVKYIAPKTQMICRFSQEARPTEDVKYKVSSHAFGSAGKADALSRASTSRRFAAVGWTRSGRMTANKPSRLQEAVTHDDIEIHDKATFRITPQAPPTLASYPGATSASLHT